MNSALRKSFEAWASAHWAQGLDAAYVGHLHNYDDSIVQDAWDAYQAAHKAALSKAPTAWYVKATGAFHLNYERIAPNEFLLGVTELMEPL